jgi:hypothetical protein
MAKLKTKKRKNKKIPIKTYSVILFVCAVVFLPSTILFFVCMLPSIVASFVDRKPQKTLGMTVGAMNFAGTLPAWLQLLQEGHTMYVSTQIIATPMVLVISYGAAAVGWAIYYNVTPFVATLMVRRAKKRIKNIEKEKKKLEKQWGIGVSALVPSSKN